ncbi:uncharacterized acetyltransferase At3g50280 isoform X1 [Cajanus cajan]|uniref:uncharacterized acetyltransferase At3g50280 isoform X1 n=1 Tax=Cajanus cajan TaxID=3821 RepID=UPI00098D8057|nr:uncharacterized acetyltransferase At3g50280 isoform X1 [Cajanus cajan]
MSSHVVQVVSECFVKPPSPAKESRQIYNLAAWDIVLLAMQYIQTGILLQQTSLVNQNAIENFLNLFKQSISLTLAHFYPLVGRFVTQKTKDPPSTTIFIDCSNSPGVRLIHATLDMSVSDILTSADNSTIVQSLFDHHKVSNHDGHTMPLFSAKVTKLVDGLFVGCSMNHAVGDGVAFFNFISAWFEVARAQVRAGGPLDNVPISRPPIHDRWFPDGCGPFINLPFKDTDEFKRKFEETEFRERIFHFSGEFIAKLKARANWEAKTTEISSLQSLSAHAWRCITRARHLPRDQRTSCKLAIDNRSRLEPPLPNEYFGNALSMVSADSTAGELLEHDLGWAARKLNLAVANHNDKVVRQEVLHWLQQPKIFHFGSYSDSFDVTVSSSPRFNPFGNDLWLWKGVKILTGYNNNHDGRLTSSAGAEGGGSIDLEVVISPNAMSALELDEDFLDSFSHVAPMH